MPIPFDESLPERLADLYERWRHRTEAFGLNDAMLAELASVFECPWATYWSLDPEAMRLVPALVCNTMGSPASGLELRTRQRTLTFGEGAAGLVWHSRRPVWTAHLARDMCLPRSLDAAKAGLHGGAWFAIRTEASFFGVIELLREELPPRREDIVHVVEAFGTALGELMESAQI